MSNYRNGRGDPKCEDLLVGLDEAILPLPTPEQIQSLASKIAFAEEDRKRQIRRAEEAKEDEIIATLVAENPYLMALFKAKNVVLELKKIDIDGYIHRLIQGFGINNPNAIQDKLKELGKL